MLNTNNESAMSVEARKAALELSAFIEKCPSMFHTTAEISDRLKSAGFTFLPEGEAWSVERGGKYFTTRNGSTVVAFKVGEQLDNYHFQITAAHGDSPTFKLKAQSELEGPGEYMRLNTEVYGGAIDYTWFDKPLGWRAVCSCAKAGASKAGCTIRPATLRSFRSWRFIWIAP